MKGHKLKWLVLVALLVGGVLSAVAISRAGVQPCTGGCDDGDGPSISGSLPPTVVDPGPPPAINDSDQPPDPAPATTTTEPQTQTTQTQSTQTQSAPAQPLPTTTTQPTTTTAETTTATTTTTPATTQPETTQTVTEVEQTVPQPPPPPPPVDLSISGPASSVVQNGVASFTLKITNNGPAETTSADLFTLKLDPNGNLNLARPIQTSQGDPCGMSDPRKWVCSIGTIGKGASATVAIALSVTKPDSVSSWIEPGGEAQTSLNNHVVTSVVVTARQSLRSVYASGLEWGGKHFRTLPSLKHWLALRGINWQGWAKNHRYMAALARRGLKH